MFRLTKDGFEKQKKDGVYIFESPGCFTCSHHIELFKKFMSGFFVVPTKEDPEYFESIDIKITPTTRIYKNDKIVWDKEGVLFDTQIQEMRKFL
jgi:hypothetical protein